MTQSHSMDQLLNNLLSDQVLGKDLSTDEKAAVRAMVGELMGDGSEALFNPPEQPNSQTSDAIAPDADAAITPSLFRGTAQPDTLLSQLSRSLEDRSSDGTGIELLEAQSDITLIAALSDYLDVASALVEVLSTRRRKGQVLDIVRRVELQCVALSIGVADLRQALEQPDAEQAIRRPWKHQVKMLLLREFNCINNLLR